VSDGMEAIQVEATAAQDALVVATRKYAEALSTGANTFCDSAGGDLPLGDALEALRTGALARTEAIEALDLYAIKLAALVEASVEGAKEEQGG
jgi:DNA-directed RNA polymerase subunit K/omega